MKLKLNIAFILSLVVINTSIAGVNVINKWDKAEIKVCFAMPEAGFNHAENTKPWVNKNKELIKNTIMNEYTKNKTIVSFVGFKDCNQMPDADVMVYTLKGSKLKKVFLGGSIAKATIGKMVLYGSRYKHVRGYVYFEDAGFRKSTIVHEFGHILGLAHEHNHKDAYLLEGNCKFNTAQNSKPMKGFIYSDYDSESVMSYCNRDKNQGLSDGDIRVLRSMYADLEN